MTTNRLRIVSETGLAQDTDIFFGEDRLSSVRGVNISLQVDDVARVKLELLSVAINLETDQVEFHIAHPIFGELLRVRRIEFDDGTEWRDDR